MIYSMQPMLVRGRTVWDTVNMPISEFEGRISRVHHSMGTKGIDVLIVCGWPTRLGNLVYLSGHLPYYQTSHWTILLLPAQGKPMLMTKAGSRELTAYKATTWVEDLRSVSSLELEVKKVLQELNISEGVVGLVRANEMPYTFYESLMRELPNARLMNASSITEQMRIIKSERELDQIKRSSRILKACISKFRENLRTGTNEVELEAKVDRIARLEGARDFRFLIASGSDSDKPLAPAREKPVHSGDTVLLYLAVDFEGYWSEVGRTFALDHASEDLREFHRSALDGLKSMLSNTRRGASTSQVAEALIQGLRESDSLQYLQSAYGFGNGIGLDVAEDPFIGERNTSTLQSGMVLSLRVGLCKPHLGGAFISDVITVADDGYEPLTPPDDGVIEV